MFEFIKNHIGHLTLFILVLVMLGFLLHVSHHNSDATTVGWAKEQTSLVLGGLLGLVTGAKLAKSDEEKK